MMISMILLFYYVSKPEMGLGVFVVGFIFFVTALYYFAVNRVANYFFKISNYSDSLTINCVILILIFLPIPVHLYLLDII